MNYSLPNRCSLHGCYGPKNFAHTVMQRKSRAYVKLHGSFRQYQEECIFFSFVRVIFVNQVAFSVNSRIPYSRSVKDVLK